MRRTGSTLLLWRKWIIDTSIEKVANPYQLNWWMPSCNSYPGQVNDSVARGGMMWPCLAPACLGTVSEAGVSSFSYLDEMALRQARNAAVELRTKGQCLLRALCQVQYITVHVLRTRISPFVSIAWVPAWSTHLCAHSMAIMRIIWYPTIVETS